MWQKLDPLLLAIISAFILGTTLPLTHSAHMLVSQLAYFGVSAVFFAYGLRIRLSEIWHSLQDWKLHSIILAITYLVFPALGFTIYHLLQPFNTSPLLNGVLFLSLLPSTVQASVSFTALAHGDIARAVCAATISNLGGIFLTPLLLTTFMNVDGDIKTGIYRIVLQILCPFIVGQCFQYWVGDFMRAHLFITKTTDTIAIALIVFSVSLGASRSGIWQQISFSQIIVTITLVLLLLLSILGISYTISKVLRFPYGSKVPILMCGSTKSLSTGLPIALAIFPTSELAPLIVPLLLYHQLQAFLGVVLAIRLKEKHFS